MIILYLTGAWSAYGQHAEAITDKRPCASDLASKILTFLPPGAVIRRIRPEGPKKETQKEKYLPCRAHPMFFLFQS
jgi:hypothetical protein